MSRIRASRVTSLRLVLRLGYQYRHRFAAVYSWIRIRTMPVRHDYACDNLRVSSVRQCFAIRERSLERKEIHRGRRLPRDRFRRGAGYAWYGPTLRL